MSDLDHKAAKEFAEFWLSIGGSQQAVNFARCYFDLREKARDMLDFMKRAPVSSGVCCCGEEIARHSLTNADHCPVDMWNDAVIQYEKTFRAILGDDHE